MIKVQNKAEDEPISLKWTWRPENVDAALLCKVNASDSANALIDQKDVTNDASDYLWYITRYSCVPIFFSLFLVLSLFISPHKR